MRNIDYETIILAQEGNEDATNYIYNSFKPIMIKKAKNAIVSINNHGIDIDDIIQEEYIGLDEAIKNYIQDEAASFYTFAMICIERQIANFIRKSNNNKAKILNEALTIDDSIEKIVGTNIDIEKSITGREYDYHIIELVRNSLTTFERDVLDLKLKDFSLDEMAVRLNKDKKAIYNAIQRIKVKFKKNEKNDN